MGNTISKSTLFPAKLAGEMFNKVKGKSSLAKLSGSEPIPFTGKSIFTFNFDNEVSVVAENGKKANGGGTVTPKTVVPVKFEYGMRVSDEFLYAAEEDQIEILKSFAEGFSRKLARGIDIAAFHGVNPRTGEASAVIGDNCFDAAVTANVVTYDSTAPDANIDAAVALVEASDAEATGIAIAPAMRGHIAALAAQGARKYPEFAFGGMPETMGAMALDVNSTVSFGDSLDRAVVGDFAGAFRWGFAKEIPLKVIEYGNPDNDDVAGDLQGANQVYLRAEAYVGWAIMDPSSFAIVAAEAETTSEVVEGET
ncbi:MAG: phage major capsid protein [Lachnospiraceae bacterium]|nr:phage major capsid protein [Lachnospiraceae bacterium]